MKEHNNIVLHREVLESIPDDVLNFIRTYDRKNILKRHNEDDKYLRHTYYDSSVVYTETEMWYSHTTYTISNTKNPFLKSGKKIGFTYDLKTRKIKFWLGSNIMSCIDFFRKKYTFITHELLTNTTCAGLISGEIKTLYQLCEKYIKANKLTCSTKNLYDCIKKETFNKKIFFTMCKISYDTQDDILIAMKNHKINIDSSIFDRFDLKISSSMSKKKYLKKQLKYNDMLTNMVLASMKQQQIVSDDIYDKYPYNNGKNVVYIKTNIHLAIMRIKYKFSNDYNILYGVEFIYKEVPTIFLIYKHTTKIKTLDGSNCKEISNNIRIFTKEILNNLNIQ